MKNQCTLLAILFLSAGCRPAGGLSESVVRDEAQSSCSELSPLTTEELDGEQVFALSSRCVFNREVHSVHLRILSETFQKVLDTGCRDVKAGYGHVIELEFNGHRVPDVGIKVRGNSSKCNEKRQFRLKFDEKDMYSIFSGQEEKIEKPSNKARTFFGLESINLRASANDPSMIRERLASKVYTQVEEVKRTAARGGLTYRVAFTKLFISHNRKIAEGAEANFQRAHNGYWYDYKGLYGAAENIDKTYLKSRFQTGDRKVKGTLIQADLAEAHFDRDRYSRRGWKAEYVKGKKADEEERLAEADSMVGELIDLLDTASTEAELASVIDVENVVNYVAATYLTGHWDSLLTNRNNDYIFWNDQIERWQLITWDLDNSFGVIYPEYRRIMADDIFRAGNVHQVKLFSKLFAPEFPTFRSRLKERFEVLSQGYYKQDNMNQVIEDLEKQVRDNTESWEQYTPQNYIDLKNFVGSRHEKIRRQL